MKKITNLIEKVFDTEAAFDMVLPFIPKLALGILTLIVGAILIKKVVKLLKRFLSKKSEDQSLTSFLTSFLRVALYIVLLIAVAGILGIETTSLIAVLGAAGLAIGLALQGSLSNFAGGVLILFFKPFRVGDVIEAQGFTGKVNEIQIFNTVLKTFDNRTIILPNGSLANNPVMNITLEKDRRVDMEFGISYKDDFRKAKEIIMDIVRADERITDQPDPPFIALKTLGDNAVILVLRVWCEADNYWNIYFEMQEKVKLAFDAEAISIPFPQRDVHIYNEK